MMFGKKVLMLAAAILVVSLWGCSSDFDAENNPTLGGTGAPVVDAASIGAGNCIGCHGDPVLFPDATVVADYLLGKHVIHSLDVDAAAGDCLTCHDPIGDGRSLESLIAPADIPLAGLAAVTCEACHGAGGDHATNAAALPVPSKTPDYDSCGQCHNADFTHNTYHPEADNIVENYTASKHFSGSVRNLTICVKCHSDEGARLYVAIDSAVDLANTLPVTEANTIQCRTCHDSHNNGRLLEADTLADPDPDLHASAEYNTCTNCHQRHDAAIGAIADGITPVGASISDGASGELIFHAGNWDRVISSTHWDKPDTADKVEGYTMDPKNERVCRDCHNVHGADATINKQWASSAHASKIRDAKLTAVGPRELQDPPGAPFINPIDQLTDVRNAGADKTHALPHYDWDDTGGWNGTARGECQMCHTATGAKNFLTDPVNYDLTGGGNDFSHLKGWSDGSVTPASSSGQNELIYCWACHSDNSGTLLNPGAVTLPSYKVNDVNPTLPDLGKSNVCINCHGGRGNLDSHTDAYYTMTNDPATDMSLLSPGGYANSATKKNVTNTHYFAASATIFQAITKIGYEYADLSYSDKSFYAHKMIGLNNDSPDTGSGPCAACHMTAKNHGLDVVEKTGEVITALKGTICVTCHNGQHALFVAQELVGTTQNLWNGTAAVPTAVTQQMATDAATELEKEAKGFSEALDMLQAALLAKSLTFGNYPYFSGPSWINEGTFGAALNFNYLKHEPGAYAHNRYYAKRLIFDSIDWLDNGVLDNTITIDAGIYPEADIWLGSGLTRP
jgi:hypothetical protein